MSFACVMLEGNNSPSFAGSTLQFFFLFPPRRGQSYWGRDCSWSKYALKLRIPHWERQKTWGKAKMGATSPSSTSVLRLLLTHTGSPSPDLRAKHSKRYATSPTWRPCQQSFFIAPVTLVWNQWSSCMCRFGVTQMLFLSQLVFVNPELHWHEAGVQLPSCADVSEELPWWKHHPSNPNHSISIISVGWASVPVTSSKAEAYTLNTSLNPFISCSTKATHMNTPLFPPIYIKIRTSVIMQND